MERIELSLSVWKTDVLPLNDIRLATEPLVGKQGLEPRPPGPKPGALTLTPHPAKRKARWRWPESNRLRRRLQGATAALAVTPDRQAAAKLPWPAVSWCSRYGRVNNHACMRGSQGRPELDPHSAGFGDRLPIRWLIPRQMKTAPAGLSLGAVAGECLLALTQQPLRPQDRSGQPEAARPGSCTRLVSAPAMSSYVYGRSFPGSGQLYFGGISGRGCRESTDAGHDRTAAAEPSPAPRTPGRCSAAGPAGAT